MSIINKIALIKSPSIKMTSHHNKIIQETICIKTQLIEILCNIKTTNSGLVINKYTSAIKSNFLDLNEYVQNYL